MCVFRLNSSLQMALSIPEFHKDIIESQLPEDFKYHFDLLDVRDDSPQNLAFVVEGRVEEIETPEEVNSWPVLGTSAPTKEKSGKI